MVDVKHSRDESIFVRETFLSWFFELRLPFLGFNRHDIIELQDISTKMETFCGQWVTSSWVNFCGHFLVRLG